MFTLYSIVPVSGSFQWQSNFFSKSKDCFNKIKKLGFINFNLKTVKHLYGSIVSFWSGTWKNIMVPKAEIYFRLCLYYNISLSLEKFFSYLQKRPFLLRPKVSLLISLFCPMLYSIHFLLCSVWLALKFCCIQKVDATQNDY